jgi:hypothetical protein
MRFLGIDLAWAEGSEAKPARETGVVALDPSGEVVDAGWTKGLVQSQAWIAEVGQADTLLFIDAPLVVDNPSGQRLCETQVGRCYGRWKVSANTTNLQSPRLAGVHLRQRLEALGWRYDDGRSGPPTAARVMSECYPYTTQSEPGSSDTRWSDPYTSASRSTFRGPSSDRCGRPPATSSSPVWGRFVQPIHPSTCPHIRRPGRFLTRARHTRMSPISAERT